LFLFEPVIIEASHRAYGRMTCALAGRSVTTQLGSLFGKDKGTAS
jgi:hypothetical protein